MRFLRSRAASQNSRIPRRMSIPPQQGMNQFGVLVVWGVSVLRAMTSGASESMGVGLSAGDKVGEAGAVSVGAGGADAVAVKVKVGS